MSSGGSKSLSLLSAPAKDEAHWTREFLYAILDNVPSMITVVNANDLTYAFVNRALEEQYGLSRNDMVGKTAHELFPKEMADGITARDKKLIEEDRELFFEVRAQITARGQRFMTSRRVPVRGERGELRYIVSVIEDVTERQRAQGHIAHMAPHDPLTDLPNRAAFNEKLTTVLEHAENSGTTFAVLCVDLDRFKDVNDVFGHAAGDALLCEVARRLHAAAGSAFLARLGGDEFIVIEEIGPQPSTSEATAQRLLQSVTTDIEIRAQLLRIGLSIGGAVYPNDGKDATTLLANADAALYRAKAEGRGAVRFFDARMDESLRERRTLQYEMRFAIEHNELTLHYQPQARVGGEITGFEALARWHHPTRGMIAPASFIPLAEESGLIMPLGEWILREACREAASWPLPLQIAVNISPIQIRLGDLPSIVHAILLETGLAPHRLELEVTESALVGDFARAISILRRLKTLGVRVVVDDFGAGSSSLSYLQAFPFDKIKIDRTFIANLANNPQSIAIVRAVIDLGHGLHLPVVAEGVETGEQLAILTNKFCDEMQGFYIGRPAPIDAYAHLVGRRINSGTTQKKRIANLVGRAGTRSSPTH